MKLKVLSIVLVGALFFSCGKKVIATESKKIEEVTEVTLNQNQLEGKRYYDTSCGKCHKLYNPKDYKADQWVGILKKMQPKAKITDEAREQIYDYITASL